MASGDSIVAGAEVSERVVRSIAWVVVTRRLLQTADGSERNRSYSAIGRLRQLLLLDGALYHRSDGFGALPHDVGVRRSDKITRPTRRSKGVRAQMFRG